MAVRKILTVLKALLLSYFVTALILVLLTTLLYRFGMGQEIVPAGVVAAYILSCFAGGFVIGKKQKEKKYLWGALTGAGYFVVLVLISLVMYGGIQAEFGNFVTSMVMCVGSGTIGGMVS